MDLEKVKAVRDWPTLTTRKQLQRFLGFENFYTKFIKNFSSTVLTLPDHYTNHFNFHLSFKPGSKNTKPDALP